MTLITPGFYGPRHLVITDDTNEQGYLVTAEVVPHEGRYQISSATFAQIEGGPPVQRGAVGKIPLDNFLRFAADYVLMQIREDEKEQFNWVGDSVLPDGSFMLTVRTRGIIEALHQTKGHTPQSDADFLWIARLYRWHRIMEGKPTAMMAERLGVSRATMKRWTAKAVEKGYLTSEERTR